MIPTSLRKLPRRGVHRAPGTLRALLGGWRASVDPEQAAGPAIVQALEREASQAWDVPHVVAVGSGRSAQGLLLCALGLSPGDAVMLPALTFHAVPTGVRDLGLEPVFGDVDPATLLLDPQSVEDCQHPRLRVVLATHLLGVPCDMTALQQACESKELVLLEDFAQAAGARWQGRAAGSIGRAGFTSLETVKPLSAFGGGLITTSDPTLAQSLREMASALPAPDPGRLARKVLLGHVEAALARPDLFGLLAWPFMSDDGSSDLISRYKKRKQGAGNHGASLHPAQAAVGRANLRHLDEHLARRRHNAETLRGMLRLDAWRQQLRQGDEPSWYQVVANIDDVPGCARAARHAGVDLGVGAITDQSDGACPHAAHAAAYTVQLPCHPGLSDEDLQRVATMVNPWLR